MHTAMWHSSVHSSYAQMAEQGVEGMQTRAQHADI